jgi:glycosyltransferase involved in cell wall biosynthesis
VVSRHPSIALVTDKLAGGPSVGGAFGHLTAALAKGFLEVGVTELYVLYINEPPSVDTPYSPNVRIVPLGTGRTRRSPPAIARFIHQARPDFLISMPSPVSVATLAGSLLAWRHHTRVVVNQGDTLTSDVAIEHSHDLRMRSLPLFARVMYRYADGLVAVTEGVLDLMRANGLMLPPERVTVIPNPVDIERVQARSRERPDHPWLQRKDRPVIVSLGRLVKRKNFTLLLQAFSQVQRRLPARLVIIGEGPERPFLEQEIARLRLPDVSLAGASVNPWANIARADVFAMSSLDEAFCLAIVEAMACGVPIVATDAVGGGPRAILEDGRYGSLVRSGDAVALADALLAVLSSAEVGARLAGTALERAAAFRPERVAARWCEFLRTF